MRISVLGPTNMEKFSKIINKDQDEITSIARRIGETLAKKRCEMVSVFDYRGMIKLVGDAYKSNGGRLEFLYTENDYDWGTKNFMKYLGEAHKKTEEKNWHDVLLRLVSDSDIVICTGLSAGVFVELGYMKWNYQQGKGRVKALIGIKELLNNGRFPPEISWDLENMIMVSSIVNLENSIGKFE